MATSSVVVIVGGRVPAKRTFFVRDVTEKASRAKVQISTDYSKTEVENRRWHSHTVVMADHARLTNYIPFNVGIGTCLDVTA
jgi:signal recognition particle receptor subunit beta